MQGWQYGKGLIYLSSIFRLTKLAFFRARALSVSLVLMRTANFVSRNIGLKQISPLPYHKPCIQFCFNSHFKRRLRLASQIIHGFCKKEPIGFNYALSGPLHAKVFTTCISYSFSGLFSALNCCH